MTGLLFCAALASTVHLADVGPAKVRFRVADDAQYVTLYTNGLAQAEQDALAQRAETYRQRGLFRPNGNPRTPLMGWSSWNTFAIDISEEIILGVARAMATNGLKEAGYLYVNIDDGFYYGRDERGHLRWHPKRFPTGMKGLVDGIHALGLKAGTYSDAGANSCASGNGSADPGGVGAGLYGYDADDCHLHFTELGFDFIKVDYCGGRFQHLDERQRYTEIATAIRATGRTDVRFNICRWAFPGTWAADIAESWRTTYDIRASWKAVQAILKENLYLSAYARPGHFNDMDMLEVDRIIGTFVPTFGGGTFGGDTGLTRDEETTHFGMWCMLSSPLLLGCDPRKMSVESLRLVTNPYLLALNQDGLGLQAYVVRRDGEAYTFVKDAEKRFGTSRYVALYNGNTAAHTFTLKAADVDLVGHVALFDLVARADVGTFQKECAITVPPHATRFFRLDAAERLERTVYEAETAYLTDYQELRLARDAGTPYPEEMAGASGGVVVRQLGNRDTNDLIFPAVDVRRAGRRTLSFRCTSPRARTFEVAVDGVWVGRVAVPQTAKDAFAEVSLDIPLTRGVHTLRLYNPFAFMPDIDVMYLD